MKYKLLCYIKHRWAQHPDKSNIQTCKRCKWIRATGWSAETKGEVKTKVIPPAK